MKKLNLSEELNLEVDADGSNVKDKLEQQAEKDLEKANKDLEKVKKDFIKESKQPTKKLILSEDLPEEHISNVSNDDLGLTSLVSTLIKHEWESIDLYNSILLTFRQANNQEAEEILNNIINDDYVHVGQLEKLAQLINPLVNNIELGQQETESQVGAA